jgi:hypothetical protein
MLTLSLVCHIFPNNDHHYAPNKGNLLLERRISLAGITHLMMRE